MKTTSKTFMALAASALGMAALPAFAWDSEAFKVTIPFAFTAGSTTLPAGEYVISQQPGGILCIGGRKGGAILVTTPQGMSGNVNSASNLKFEQTSKGATLYEIEMAGKPATILNHAK
jgi:hypothetical protein